MASKPKNQEMPFVSGVPCYDHCRVVSYCTYDAQFLIRCSADYAIGAECYARTPWTKDLEQWAYGKIGVTPCPDAEWQQCENPALA